VTDTARDVRPVAKRALFKGVCCSTMSARDDGGELDMARLKAHIDWVIADGADAISPLGSAGEFPAFEIADRKRIIEAAIAACDHRVPVIAGTHHYSTRLTIELSRHAQEAGADALLIVPPYYMGPTPSQVMDHYRRVADAVSIPIVLYHNFAGTGVDLKTPHLVRLFEEGAIGGVKMSNSDPDRIVELLQVTGGRLAVYAGIDTVAFEGLTHGAVGWISGIPSIVPRAARRLYELIAIESDLPAARLQWKELAPLMRMLFRTFLAKDDGVQWLSVMNAALNLVGPPIGSPAPPVLPLDAATRAELSLVLTNLGYPLWNGGAC
jgi:4-hydroxy-tetrahydrodipicolinate synthase